MPQIFLRHLLIKTWRRLVSVLVTFQVSQPYSNTDLTFELKTFSFSRRESRGDVHICRSEPNAAFASRILFRTSSSALGLSSTNPKYLGIWGFWQGFGVPQVLGFLAKYLYKSKNLVFYRNFSAIQHKIFKIFLKNSIFN